MTPAFITFTQKCSTNMIKKKIISRDTLLFTVDVAPVGGFPIVNIIKWAYFFDSPPGGRVY